MSEFTIGLAALHPNATPDQKEAEKLALRGTGHTIQRAPLFLDELQHQGHAVRQAGEAYFAARTTVAEFGKVIMQQSNTFPRLRDHLESADGFVVGNRHRLGRVSLIAVAQLYIAGEMEVPTFLSGKLPELAGGMSKLDARASRQLRTLAVPPVPLDGDYNRMTQQLAAKNKEQ